MKPLTSLPIIAPLAEAWMRFISTITGHSRANKNTGTTTTNCPMRKHPGMKNNFTASYNDILIRTSKSI